MDTAGPTVVRPPNAVLAARALPDPGVVRAALELELAQLEPRRYADPQGVAELARAVLTTARAHGFVDVMGRARLLVADAASRTDDVAGAVETTRTILFQARAAGELTVAARAEAVLAWCLFRMGALGEALSHAVEAVRVLPLDAPLHLQVDHSMMLALLNGMQSSDDGYIAAFEHVLPLAERLDDDHLLLLTLNNLAWLHHTHGRAESAGPLVARILAESTAREVALTSTILDTVAAVLYDLGDLEGAEQVARAMLGPGVPEAEARARPEAMLTLAKIRVRRGDPGEALDLVRAAESTAQDRELLEIVAMASEQKSELLAALEDHSGAYEALRTSFATWKQVRDRDAENRASTLHALFETEQARQRSLLFEQLAERDALTGLWNRRHVDRVLPEVLAGDRPGTGPTSVAIVDVDHFKHINDTRSHLMGDAVLVRLGELFARVVPEPGFCARLGGEEFLLVMPDTGPAAALSLCESTRLLVEQQRWASLTDGLPVTVSIGFSTAVAGGTVSGVLGAADEALYRAKNTGRNRVHPGELPAPGGAHGSQPGEGAPPGVGPGA